MNRTQETLRLAGVVAKIDKFKGNSDYYSQMKEAPLSDGTVESLLAFTDIAKQDLVTEVNRIQYARTLLKSQWTFETSKILQDDGTYTIYVGKYPLETN